MLIMETAKVKVNVLKEGYAYMDNEGYSRANATCTLVQTQDSVVIVDTLTPWDGPFILQKLSELHLCADDITHVVSTHGHSDHNGNNNLFLKTKRHIMGYCISDKDVYYNHPFEHDEPYVIDPYLQIIPTPGHTNEDVSLVIKLDESSERLEPEQTLIIAGDAFESEQDIFDHNLWTGNSFNPKVQVNSRLKILKMAKYVIPGHGKMFQVKASHVTLTEELVKKYENQ